MGGLEIARHGTVYTAGPAEKIHSLKQFTIYIDLVTSSNGLSSFEKIFGYCINQREMNFLAGQWKDGMVLHLPDYNRQKEIHFGAEGMLKKDERVKQLISYDGTRLVLYKDAKVEKYRETGPLSFSSWSREYPLVVGTDAHGRSQWQGTIYEAAIYDRALSPKEISAVASGQWPVVSDAAERQGKKGIGLPASGFGTKDGHRASGFGLPDKNMGLGTKKEENDTRPLIHYVFSPENTYETHSGEGRH